MRARLFVFFLFSSHTRHLQDFIDVLKKDEKLRGLDDGEEQERRKEELKSKFEEGKRRYHPPGPKAGMSSREASEYKRRAALALALHPPKQSTPIDNITTQARQSMTNFDSYDSHLNSYEKVKQFRSSMDSRAKGMVGEVTGGRFEGVINADGWDSDGAEGFGFGSGEDGAYDGGGGGQYSGYHEHREHREHQGHFEHRKHREPRSHLKELNDALGFDQSVPVANPSMGELSGTFKLFGLESEEEVRRGWATECQVGLTNSPFFNLRLTRKCDEEGSPSERKTQNTATRSGSTNTSTTEAMISITMH